MNFAEFAKFLANSCGTYEQSFKTVGADVTLGCISFDQISIFGATRTIIFSNPVISFKMTGIIHTEITGMGDGLTKLSITCKDELTGEKYYEEIILSKK